MPDPTPPVALITGAAKRVGRAIALHFADAGFDIAFTYLHSQTDANSLVEEIRAKSRRCQAFQADLTDPTAAAEAIYQNFTKSFDHLNVLVNNASLYEPSAMDQTDLPQMRRLFSIHVESPLLLSRAFAPTLRANNGHIVNMLDDLAEGPWPKYLAYCASKAALWNLTLGLALELAPEVTVNGIAPGVAEWPVGFPEDQKKDYLRRVPLARAGTPDDIAQAILFLCTTGTYVTGQVLHVDGGRSIA
jgi:pteridine reductase